MEYITSIAVKDFGNLYLKMYDKKVKKVKKVSFCEDKNTICYYHLSNSEKFEKQVCFREIEYFRKLRRNKKRRKRLEIQNTHSTHYAEKGYYVNRFFIMQY